MAKSIYEVWEKSHSATGTQRFEHGGDGKVAEFDTEKKAARHAANLGGSAHGVYVKRRAG